MLPRLQRRALNSLRLKLFPQGNHWDYDSVHRFLPKQKQAACQVATPRRNNLDEKSGNIMGDSVYS